MVSAQKLVLEEPVCVHTQVRHLKMCLPQSVYPRLMQRKLPAFSVNLMVGLNRPKRIYLVIDQ